MSIRLTSARIKRLLFVVLLSQIPFVVFSQDIKPVSPSADIVNSKGSSSVDFSTGIMSYHIPLFNIAQDGLSIPIGLTYTGKGVKVDEDSGITGYGWTLNTGASAIVRTMRGSSFDEDRTYGILFNDISPSAYEKINSNKQDAESDLFHLSLMGRKVSFFLKKFNQDSLLACPLEESLIKIRCHFQSDRHRINGWTVVDEQGNIFKFEASQVSGLLAREAVSINSFGTASITSWVVSTIKVLNKGNIEFIYEDGYSTEDAHFSQSKVFYTPAIQERISDAALDVELNNLISQISDQDLQSRLRENVYAINNQINFLERSNYRLSITNPDAGINEVALNNYNDQLKMLYAELTNVDINNSMLESKIHDVLRRMFSYKLKYQDYQNSSGVNYFADKLLKEIRFKNGSVKFSLTDKYFGGVLRKVYDKITFQILGLTQTVLIEGNTKGFLKKLTVADQQEYLFNYYEEDASILKWQHYQDYWGFYNGISNKSLIPSNFTMSLPILGQEGFSLFPAVGLPGDDFLKILNDKGFLAVNYREESNKTADRSVDPLKSIFRSLKTVNSNLGYTINFEYEGNEVYIADANKNVAVGGIRIRSIETKGNSTPALKISYQYKFPLLSDGSISRSTGVLDQWGKWTFATPYLHSVNKQDLYIFSAPVYTGVQAEDNSNNGVNYHYVEEKRADGSYTGYKYPAILSYKSSYSIDCPISPGNTLMAKIDYDHQGKIQKIMRNQYSYNTSLLGNRTAEHSLLSVKSPYFVAEGYRAPRLSLRQVKKEPVFYSLEEVTNTGSTANIVSFRFGSNYYSNDLNKLFESNFKPRTTHDFLSKMKPYTIESGGRPILRKQEEFLFGNYDVTAAYQAGNFAGLPDEKAYLYERLINASAIPQVKQSQVYYYENPEHNYTTKIEEENSEGQKQVTRIKYPQDYKNLTVNEPITQGINTLVSLNVVAAVIEKSTFKVSSTGINNLVSSSFTSFKPTSGLTDKLFSIENEGLLNDFSVSTVENGVVKKDSRYKTKLQFNRYDENGNLQEVEREDGTKETSLWGYKGQYKVANILGSNYGQVSALVNQSILNNGTSQEIKTELIKLRSGLAIGNALVSTSTYAPHIGLTSTTDPSGKKLEYIYNYYGDGKLDQILDQSGNIVEKYEYSKPKFSTIYNSQWKHGSFIRAVDGIAIQYSVAPGRYRSSVSQSDADYLAEYDLSNNGQAYADAVRLVNWSDALKKFGDRYELSIEVYDDLKRMINTERFRITSIVNARDYYRLPDDARGYSMLIKYKAVGPGPLPLPKYIFTLTPGDLQWDQYDSRYDSVSGLFVIDTGLLLMNKGESHTLTAE